jgi:hypothetical protein
MVALRMVISPLSEIRDMLFGYEKVRPYFPVNDHEICNPPLRGMSSENFLVVRSNRRAGLSESLELGDIIRTDLEFFGRIFTSSKDIGEINEKDSLATFREYMPAAFLLSPSRKKRTSFPFGCQAAVLA